MTKQITTNKTRYSLRGVVTKANVLVKNAKRDANELSNYGITEAFLADLQLKIKTLENVERYETAVSQVSEITYQRNLEVKNLQRMLRVFVSQIEIIYEGGAIKKPGFINNSISALKVAEAIEFAKNLSVELLNQMQWYATVGITAQRVAELEALTQKVIELHETKDFEYTQLDNKTSHRNQLRMQVENSIRHLSRIGKAHWGVQNRAFYRDYVLNKPSATTAKESADTPSTAQPDPESVS